MKEWRQIEEFWKLLPTILEGEADTSMQSRRPKHRTLYSHSHNQSRNSLPYTVVGFEVVATQAESEQEQLLQPLVVTIDYHKFRFENQYVRVLEVLP